MGIFLFYKPDIKGKQVYYSAFLCADELHMVAYNTFTIFKVHGQEQRPSSRLRLCMTAWPCLVTKLLIHLLPKLLIHLLLPSEDAEKIREIKVRSLVDGDKEFN